MLNYLDALTSSSIEVYLENFSDFKITDSGLYILCPTFDLESITGERYLKVGMTIEQRGLKGRLGAHFSSSTRIKNGKLISNTVLARHLHNDSTLAKYFKLDFTKLHDRRVFLKDFCYFRVLPLLEFNWTSKEQKQNSRCKLRDIESQQIEEPLRKKTRYIDSVKPR
tara:strand:+ start:63 stop:563 length:501 start_codon:yes stop_codon:yes gene_type:complete